jgi:hypothetical protein
MQSSPLQPASAKPITRGVTATAFAAATCALLLSLPLVLLAPVPTAAQPLPAAWQFAGPGGAVGMQPGGMLVSSAANAVARTGSGAWLLATVNGGVWRTTDPTTKEAAHWTPVFDGGDAVACASMTTLGVSPDGQRVYAGCGASTSSQQGYAWNVVNSGDWAGVAVSGDGGVTWAMTGFPAGYSVQAIVELPTGEVLVSARGSYTDQSDGGIWRLASYPDAGNRSAWTRVFSLPTFSLVADPSSQTVFASAAAVDASKAVWSSWDRGQTWAPVVEGLSFAGGMQPAYSTLALTPGRALFLGVMLAPPDWVRNGLQAMFGAVYYLNTTLGEMNGRWQIVGAQPMAPSAAAPTRDCVYNCSGPADCCSTIDQDDAAKDRMALLVHPDDPSILFLAGNANVVVYRIDWRRALGVGPCTVNATSGACFNPAVDMYIWTPMWNQGAPFRADTIDGQQPHVDCRNFAWDPVAKALLLVSDGGIFVRFKPESNQGWWRGWAGDIGTFEYVRVGYDPKLDRWVAGAQDNDVQFSALGATQNPHAPAGVFGLGCDGTIAEVDSVNDRMYGSCYNNGALSFVSLSQTKTTGPVNPVMINVAGRGFPLINSPNVFLQTLTSPFFQMAVRLNRKNPMSLYFWANVTSVLGEGPGIFALDVTKPDGSGPNATLKLASDGENLQCLEAGGTIDGVLREDVVVAASGRHLFTQVGATRTKQPLPTPFAEPCDPTVVQLYCDLGVVSACTPGCQNWPSHAESQTMAVHPSNARVVAVTGWPDLATNQGTEHIYLTRDSGATWVDVMGDLAAATGSMVGKARPTGLAFIGADALAVGTVNGVFVTTLNATTAAGAQQHWRRLGSRAQFPMVKVQQTTYLPDSDLVFVGTLGRGVYVLRNAAAAISGNGAPVPAPAGSDDGKIIAIAVCVPLAVVIVLVAVVWFRRRSAARAGTSSGYNSVLEQQGAYTQHQQ